VLLRRAVSCGTEPFQSRQSHRDAFRCEVFVLCQRLGTHGNRLARRPFLFFFFAATASIALGSTGRSCVCNASFSRMVPQTPCAGSVVFLCGGPLWMCGYSTSHILPLSALEDGPNFSEYDSGTASRWFLHCSFTDVTRCFLSRSMRVLFLALLDALPFRSMLQIINSVSSHLSSSIDLGCVFFECTPCNTNLFSLTFESQP